MKIDLTYKCSMGCTHCMSSCTADDTREMSIETLESVLDFCKEHYIFNLTFSGGELFEHSQIKEVIKTIMDKMYLSSHITSIVFTTNGRVLSSDFELLELMKGYMKDSFYKGKIFIQVTDDERYYPTKLDKKQMYRLERLNAIIEGVPTYIKENPDRCLYPQGRALENFNDSNWFTKAPKCTNVRLVAKQNPDITFCDLVRFLFMRGFMCTPSIAPDGSIKLGESALCPAVASISDSSEVIIEKILNFKCNGCPISESILDSDNPEIAKILDNK